MTRNSPRRFGAIRKLPSGRLQVRYWGPDGVRRSAPETFATKAEADRYLTLLEAQLMRQEWIDPNKGKVKLALYADGWIKCPFRGGPVSLQVTGSQRDTQAQTILHRCRSEVPLNGHWINERPKLRPRTVALYRWLLDKHISPHLGDVEIGNLTTPMVRRWRVKLLALGVSENGVAKAYRLFRAILNTAVKEDELIRVNPCRIPGADQEHPAERPVLTVRQVMTLADKMPERYRALVLLATFGCLRWGEVAVLQRCDVDLAAGTVRVRQAFTEQRGKGMVLGPPKSKAGLRTVSVPASIIAEIRAHLDTHVKEWPDSFVFTTEGGKTIWRGNFNKIVKWRKVVGEIGMPGLHFHDLRHTGNTLAAQTGTSLRDLMARMGHDNPRAALIYQHATSGAARAVAAALDEALKAHKAGRDQAEGDAHNSDEDRDDGAAGVLGRVS